MYLIKKKMSKKKSKKKKKTALEYDVEKFTPEIYKLLTVKSLLSSPEDLVVLNV